MEDNRVLAVYDYTDKSIVVCGSEDLSRKHKEIFKDKGGKWNSSLKGQFKKGWIFPRTKQEAVTKVVERINNKGSIRESADSLPEEDVSVEVETKAVLTSNNQVNDYEMTVKFKYKNAGVFSLILNGKHGDVRAVMIDGKWQIENYPFPHVLEIHSNMKNSDGKDTTGTEEDEA